MAKNPLEDVILENYVAVRTVTKDELRCGHIYSVQYAEEGKVEAVHLRMCAKVYGKEEFIMVSALGNTYPYPRLLGEYYIIERARNHGFFQSYTTTSS